MNAFRSRIVLVVAVLCAVIAAYLLFAGNRLIAGSLDPDTNQYLQFASVIAGTPIAELPGAAPFNQGIEIRAPGYPLLLALVLKGAGGFTAQGMLLVHWLLFSAALLAVLAALSSDRERITGLAAVLVCSLLTWHEFIIAVSEWAVYCVLLLLGAGLLTAFRFGRSTALRCGMLLSVLALLRPELVLAAPVVGAALLLRKGRRLRVAAQLALGLVPLLVWIGANRARTGRFIVAPSFRIGLASFLPVPTVRSTDSAEMRALIAGMHALPESSQLITLGESLLLVNQAAATRLGENVGYGWEIGRKAGLSLEEQDRLFSRYFARAVQESPGLYARLVAMGMSTLYILLPLAALLICRRRSIEPALAAVAWTFIVLHAARITAMSMLNLVHLRFICPTLAPACVFTLLAWWSAESTTEAQARAIPSSR